MKSATHTRPCMAMLCVCIAVVNGAYAAVSCWVLAAGRWGGYGAKTNSTSASSALRSQRCNQATVAWG